MSHNPCGHVLQVYKFSVANYLSLNVSHRQFAAELRWKITDHYLPISICHRPQVKDAPRSFPIDHRRHPGIPTVFLDALSVRLPVFVEEQKVLAENELDEEDERAHHVVLYTGTNNPIGYSRGLPMCTLRFVEVVLKQDDWSHYNDVNIPEGWEIPPAGPLSFKPGADPLVEPVHYPSDCWDGKEPYIKLGRMATLKVFRKQAMAKKLLQWTFGWILNNQEQFSLGHNTLILVHAQREVQHFYATQGFVLDVIMGVWVEEGIDHVGMWKRLKPEEQATLNSISGVKFRDPDDFRSWRDEKVTEGSNGDRAQ